MSIVAAYAYANGVRVREVDLDAPETLRVAENEFVWIGLVDPDEAELRVLQKQYGLHPLAVEDAIHANQMPKVDVYGEQLFVVARTARLVEDEIHYGETDIFVGPQHIITVRHGSLRDHNELRVHLEAAPNLLKRGVDYVLHAVLDFIVDGYLPLVEAIEEDVLAMERHTLDCFLDRAEVARLFNLRRELMRFRRLLAPMEEVAARLLHHDLPCIDAEIRLYFGDVRDHVRRVATMVEGLREVLASVFEVSSLLEQQRQGQITRRLAAWAAILAVPTAVAGIYGMNFENMPELRWRYGYYGVVALIVAVCVGLFTRFRKARWL
jgi:magnesium transporter